MWLLLCGSRVSTRTRTLRPLIGNVLNDFRRGRKIVQQTFIVDLTHIIGALFILTALDYSQLTRHAIKLANSIAHSHSGICRPRSTGDSVGDGQISDGNEDLDQDYYAEIGYAKLGPGGLVAL